MKKAMISNPPGMLIQAACFIVIIAGMRAASDLLVPFLLALFIAIICSPLLVWLRKKGVPNFLAVIILFAGIIVAVLLLTFLIGNSVNDFSSKLPEYQKALTVKMAVLFHWLKDLGFNISIPDIMKIVDPGVVMRLAANTLSGFTSMVSDTLLILLMVVFILMEAAGFPAKLKKIFAKSGGSMGHLEKMAEGINRYIAIKTVISLATGVFIATWLLIIGVDYALLWGVLAFLLNYIPNIGSIIAAIPAVLLALIQNGTGTALLATGGYIVVNTVVGSILEPKFLGSRLGLSTLVVFLSMIFWGWVMGPVGMILSIPLTMIIKIALEKDEERKWIAILLDS